MKKFIREVRSELTRNSNPEIRKSARRFSKEEIDCYGIRAAGIRMIAKTCWPELRSFNKKEIFIICGELLRSKMLEESALVALWLPKLKKQFEKNDIDLFRKWVDHYITNWAACDGFCNHTVGDYLARFPESIGEVKSWARSKNRWMKRASAVSLVIPARQGEFLKEVFEIADRLLEDPDDMVQKGYGWMLKEASKKHREEVFKYVMKNRFRMPRTALRYAIEKMPDKMRAEVMK